MGNIMLNETILKQLKEHFSELGNEITLQYRISAHEKQEELVQMLQSVASVSDKINVTEDSRTADVIPSFTIRVNNEPTGIFFRGIPGGHEFSSLILAILNADGKGKWPDASITARVRNLNVPASVTTYVSLSCTNCPDVVQAFNQMCLMNPGITHTMTVGDLAGEEVESLGIQGVPAVFHEKSMIHSGRASFGELLSALEKEFGFSDTEKAAEHSDFDVAVIGGGPAGCAAAIYSARKGLKTAIIAGRIGGQVNDTAEIANLISVPSTTGSSLAADLRIHAEQYNLSIFENRTVLSVEPSKEESGNHSIFAEKEEVFKARQIIVATGASWRKLGIPGEDEYIGRGVAFCPHCDGPFFAGKDVAVIGGGNSGVEAAIDLAGICRNVTVFEFLDDLKADTILQNKLQSLSNVKIQTGTRTTEITGNGSRANSLKWKKRDGSLSGELKLDGVFVQIGLVPNSGPVKDVAAMNKFGEILIDTHGRTSVKGIYAAGDVTTVPYKQIVIAMGEGAKSALTAFDDRIRL